MVEIFKNAKITDTQLNGLFGSSWPNHTNRYFGPVLERSLAYFSGFDNQQLVAYLNLAWDGGRHGFLLDTTVHPSYRRQGIALEMIGQAKKAASKNGLEWLHVDFESKYEQLYLKAGFGCSSAGVLRLTE